MKRKRRMSLMFAGSWVLSALEVLAFASSLPASSPIELAQRVSGRKDRKVLSLLARCAL